jgi:hypothetical protein
MKSLIFTTCTIFASALLGLCADPATGADTKATAVRYAEPFPARVSSPLPNGWELAELKGQPMVHGPFTLPDGQRFTFTTPVYMLEPELKQGGVYVVEPGFAMDDQNGTPRAKTLGAVLTREMESLRQTSIQLAAISGELKKLQDFVQRQQGGTATAKPEVPDQAAASGASPNAANSKVKQFIKTPNGWVQK